MPFIEQRKSCSVAEAVATLRQPLRRKNLSESRCFDKENENPIKSNAASRIMDHRLMLQEHVRRIRGRRIEHDELDEMHDPEQKTSPQRANRYSPGARAVTRTLQKVRTVRSADRTPKSDVRLFPNSHTTSILE